MLIKIILLSILILPISLIPRKANSSSEFYEKDPLADLRPGKEGLVIKLGYEILTNTPEYIGLNGKMGKYIQNKMSCTNCHLNGGTLEFGNSWVKTHARYPQYRIRDAAVQTLADRVNICLINNHGGVRLPESSQEMQSILMYMKWIGRGSVVEEKPDDDRLAKLEFLDRAASAEKGKAVYEKQCLRCHASNGAGQLNEKLNVYKYPPLWGPRSFVSGASMSRISLMARFVFKNMPLDQRGSVSVEEAWDVSAYILSHARPKWRLKKVPFSDIVLKPFDYPLPPFKDPFKLEQHLFGPFKPIIEYYQKNEKNIPDNTSLHI